MRTLIEIAEEMKAVNQRRDANGDFSDPDIDRWASEILFDDGYTEGWAKCIAMCKEAFATPAPSPKEAAEPFGYVVTDTRGGLTFYKSHPYLDTAVACEAVYLRAALATRGPKEASEDEIGAALYQGNTVSYMYQKAKAYGDVVLRMHGALVKAGFAAKERDNNVEDMLAAALATRGPIGAVEPAERWDKKHLRLALIAFAMLCDCYANELPEDAMALAEDAQEIMDAEFADTEASTPIAEIMGSLRSAILALSRTPGAGNAD